MWIKKIVCSRAKSYENDPQITQPQISAKCIIPDINDLENYGQGHVVSLSKRMHLNDDHTKSYHHTKFELPNAFHKNYMKVQSCIMSTLFSINIVHLFRQTIPQNAKIEISIK